ncbi:hypothetical protein RQP46_002625 [Phenoliferia psychrophenolica]
MPRPTPTHYSTSRDCIDAPHLLAKFAAAESLHLYSTSPPIAAQTAKLRSEAVGWMLPNWKTSTTVRCVGNASVWYDVMKNADRLSRLAMRDSCSTFKRLYEELDFDELDLSRVAFNCRYKKRIYALDYRALELSSLDDEAAPIIIAAVPVLREIRAFGRERSKVVLCGSIFFSFLCMRAFGRPLSVSPAKFDGTVDPSTRFCGINTPAKRALVEWIHYAADDRQTRPLWPPVPRMPPSISTFIESGESHIERWTSIRNTSFQPIVLSMLFRSRSREYSPATIMVVRQEGYVAQPDVDRIFESGSYIRQSSVNIRNIVSVAPEYEEYRAWESEALDGDGLDDTFTLEQISQIVTGRYKGPSSAITSWGNSYIQDEDVLQCPRDISNQYLMLLDLGIGWYPMTASRPELDDLWIFS